LETYLRLVRTGCAKKARKLVRKGSKAIKAAKAGQEVGKVEKRSTRRKELAALRKEKVKARKEKARKAKAVTALQAGRLSSVARKPAVRPRHFATAMEAATGRKAAAAAPFFLILVQALAARVAAQWLRQAAALAKEATVGVTAAFLAKAKAQRGAASTREAARGTFKRR
jgi:hypothetical protein